MIGMCEHSGSLAQHQTAFRQPSLFGRQLFLRGITGAGGAKEDEEEGECNSPGCEVAALARLLWHFRASPGDAVCAGGRAGPRLCRERVDQVALRLKKTWLVFFIIKYSSLGLHSWLPISILDTDKQGRPNPILMSIIGRISAKYKYQIEPDYL